MSNPAGRSVALLTLGCARNEVDSEELAARLSGDGWRVSTDVEGADVVLVNTCGFVEAAKRESVDTLLAAADTGAKVVATGCLAERYGRDLAKSLPEADAVLGFDHYPDISARLSAVLAGERVDAHAPRDRRTLLPLAPAARRTPGAVVVDSHTPAHLRPVPAAAGVGTRAGARCRRPEQRHRRVSRRDPSRRRGAGSLPRAGRARRDRRLRLQRRRGHRGGEPARQGPRRHDQAAVRAPGHGRRCRGPVGRSPPTAALGGQGIARSGRPPGMSPRSFSTNVRPIAICFEIC